MTRGRIAWIAGGATVVLAALVYAGMSLAAPDVGPDPAVRGPDGVRVVDRVRELFPQTEGWFRIVAAADFAAGPKGRFEPRLQTLDHPRVRWQDGSGHTILAEFARRFDEATRVGSGERADAWVELVPMDGRAPDARLQDGLVVYPDAYASTDVLYKSTPTHVDEYLLLRDERAPTRWRYRIRTGPGIERVRQAGHGVEAVDAQGVAWLRGNAPFAVDRRGERVDGRLRVEGDVLIAEIDISSLELPVLVDPDWESTGDMAYGRFYHRANVLPDGRVLVTGGCSASVCSGDLSLAECRTVVRTAETLDLDSRTFSRGAESTDRRFFHVAESLPGGDVLVAGGCTDSTCSSVTDTAEIYAAGAATFRTVDALPVAGAGMASAPLADGRVLVAGGCDRDGCTSRAWVVDSEGESFSEVASMNVARGRATVTVLDDGRVLVAGGCTDIACGGVLDGAEVYDPTADRWTETGAMSVERAGHWAAKLPDGRVLVGGGCKDQGCGAVIRTTEILDPATLNFADAASQRQARFGALATPLPNGTILVSQGCRTHTDCNLTNELYEPGADRFSMVEPAVTSRAFHALVMHDGQELVIANGGCQPRTCSWWNETWPVSDLEPLPDGGMPDGDAGVEPPADAGPDSDPDAGTARDGGVGRDAGTDDDGGDGCGCRASSGGAGDGAGLALLALVALARRRRRRRGGGPCGVQPMRGSER